MDWFTSDYHFNHDNIIRYCNRPFGSAAVMDDWLIKNTNAHVASNDRLICLGDWIFPGRQNYAEAAKRYRDQINCKKIIYIWGNHDKKGRGNQQFMRLFDGCYDLLELDSGTQRLVLCHYAMRVWNKSHRGVWHLYGHSHYSLPDDPNSLSIDVGVDAAAVYLSQDGTLKPENYRPLSFDEVAGLMAKKAWKPIDHHGVDRKRLSEIAGEM